MNLYEQLCSFEYLYNAFLRARKGKRKQEEIAAFEWDLEPELFKIRESLLEQSYQPGGYYSFYRTEAKRRLISAAPFPPPDLRSPSPFSEGKLGRVGEGHFTVHFSYAAPQTLFSKYNASRW